MAIPTNGRRVGFVRDGGMIAPVIDFGWREHCGAGHKWTDRMSTLVISGQTVTSAECAIHPQKADIRKPVGPIHQRRDLI